jgi:hypothetical protein
LPPDQSDQDFIGSIGQAYSISGTISDQSGTPMVGVSIEDDQGHKTTTGASGEYRLIGLDEGSYVITPQYTGYEFLPASRVVNIPPSLENQNFTAVSQSGPILAFIPLIKRDSSRYLAECSVVNYFCENNDTVGDAFGELASGQIYTAYPDDTNDYYYFRVRSTTSVNVYVENFSAQGDLLLYSETNPSLPIGQWGRGGADMHIGPLLLNPGKYFMRVYVASGANVNDLYRFWVTH